MREEQQQENEERSRKHYEFSCKMEADITLKSIEIQASLEHPKEPVPGICPFIPV